MTILDCYRGAVKNGDLTVPFNLLNLVHRCRSAAVAEDDAGIMFRFAHTLLSINELTSMLRYYGITVIREIRTMLIS